MKKVWHVVTYFITCDEITIETFTDFESASKVFEETKSSQSWESISVFLKEGYIV